MGKQVVLTDTDKSAVSFFTVSREITLEIKEGFTKLEKYL